MEIKVGFNNMRASNVHQGGDVPFCTCGYETICANPGHGATVGPVMSRQAMKHTYQSIFELWEKILCLRELGKKWFNLDCVKGHYTHCDIKQLPICDKEFDSSSLSLLEKLRMAKLKKWSA
jgi:hypothetical protein